MNKNKPLKINPVGNPDIGKPENPILAHYHFGDFRLIVKRVEACRVTGVKLFVEKSTIDALGNPTWSKFDEIWLPEPESVYSFPSEEGSVLMTLAAILLYKKQDLLVDKMESK